jgi:hypothetical protein
MSPRPKTSPYRLRDDQKMYPHAVYRIFDAQDRLLYIGCTEDVDWRISQHRDIFNTLPGGDLISRSYARHTSEEYPNRLAARDAERAAIKAEAPWLNRHHNPTRWRRDGQYGAYVPVDVEGYVAFALSLLGPRPDGPPGLIVHDAYTALLARAG